MIKPPFIERIPDYEGCFINHKRRLSNFPYILFPLKRDMNPLTQALNKDRITLTNWILRIGHLIMSFCLGTVFERLFARYLKTVSFPDKNRPLKGQFLVRVHRAGPV